MKSSPLQTFGFLGAVFMMVASAPLVAAPQELVRPDGDWSTRAASPDAGLEFALRAGPAGTLRLTVRDPQRTRAVGGWMRSLPPLKQGRRYRFDATCTIGKIEHPLRQVCALITRGNYEYSELMPIGRLGDELRLAAEFTPERDERLDLRLYLADAPGSDVTWTSVQLGDVTERHRLRTARIGVIAGSPPQPKSPQDCIDFYAERLEAVAGLGLDLVCLPENANVDGLVGDRWNWLETIPGPATQRWGEVARRHRVYVVAGLAEREGARRRNTAVLLDRTGAVVGKYHKSHLTIPERMINGITEGDELPVFDTDFGRIGLLICWDYHFPESARILALKGAELIVMPNAGDGREKGALWEAGMRIRAVDNHLFMASAVNDGPSLIVSPSGEILAKNDRAAAGPGGLVHAACEFGDSVANFTGHDVGKRYLMVRRPDIYEYLTRDFGADAVER